MAYYDVFNGDADGICALHQDHAAAGLRRSERQRPNRQRAALVASEAIYHRLGYRQPLIGAL